MANTADIIKLTSADIINGQATCLRGGSSAPGSTQADYHETVSDQHISDPSGVAQWVELETRYIHHGGSGNLGPWEH